MLGTQPLASFLRLEVAVDTRFEAFPLPNGPSRIMSDQDFAEVVSRIRDEALVEFGPGADVLRGDSLP